MSNAKDNCEQLTMLQSILRRLIEDGIINVRQIAEDICIDPSTISKWSYIDGNEPKYTNVRLFFGAAPFNAQEIIAADFFHGTRWLAVYQTDDADLDVDGDGEVTVKDAIQFAINSIETNGAAVKEIHQAATDGDVDDAELAAITARCDQVMRDIANAKAAAAAAHEAKKNRDARRQQARRIGRAGHRIR